MYMMLPMELVTLKTFDADIIIQIYIQESHGSAT